MGIFQDDKDQLCFAVQKTWLDLYGWPMPGDWEAAWMGYASAHGVSAAFRSMASGAEAVQRAANNRAFFLNPPQGAAGGGATPDYETVRNMYAGVVDLPPGLPV